MFSMSILQCEHLCFFLYHVSSTQLDPQTLQGKDWQRTVIPMNGVSGSHKIKISKLKQDFPPVLHSLAALM